MNRRALLAAGPALVLAGCRGKADDSAGAPVSDTSRRGDIELLRQLIEQKARSLAAYSERHAPPGLLEIEREQLSRLRAALAERGGSAPAEPESRSSEPARARALDRMIDAEAVSIALLIDVVPKFGDPELRTLTAEMLAVEAEQLSVLRVEAGSPPLPDAFVYGTRPG